MSRFVLPKISVFVLLFCIQAASTSAWQQDCYDYAAYDPVISTIPCEASTVGLGVCGDLLITNTDSGSWGVFDCHDVARPDMLSEVVVPSVYDLAYLGVVDTLVACAVLTPAPGGQLLSFYSISQPDSPRFISSHELSSGSYLWMQDFCVEGDLVAVCANKNCGGSACIIYQRQESGTFSEINRLVPDRGLHDVASDGHWLYVSAVTGSVYRYAVDSLHVEQTPDVRSFEDAVIDLCVVEDNLVITDRRWLYIVDDSFWCGADPISRIPTQNNAVALSAVGTSLYVADYLLGLTELNLEDPAQPELVDSIYVNPGVSDVYPFGNVLAVRRRSRWVGLIERGLVGEQPDVATVNGNVYALTATDELACLNDKERIRILDVSNPFEPTLRSTIEGLPWVRQMDLEGDRLLFVQDIDNADAFYLHVASLENPDLPVVEGNCYVGYSGKSDIAQIGNTAYLLQNGLLRVIDVSDPTNPKTVTQVPIASTICNDQVIVGSRLYIAGETCQVLDISNPHEPVVMPDLSVGLDGAMFIRSENSILYTIGQNRLAAIDISNIDEPHELMNTEIGVYHSLAVSEGIAYISNIRHEISAVAMNTLGGLHWYDDICGGNTEIEIVNGCILSGGYYGLAIIPRLCCNMTPVTVSDFDVLISDACATVSWVTGVPVSLNDLRVKAEFNGRSRLLDPEQVSANRYIARDEEAWCAAGGDLFYTLEVAEEGGSWNLVANKRISVPQSRGANDVAIYPNPFNAETTVSFRLGRKIPVDVNVYDAGGRFITRLAAGVMEPGQNSVTWNGRDDRGRTVASGMYYIRIDCDSRTVRSAVSLVK